MEEADHAHRENDDWVISCPEDEGMDASLLEGLALQFEGWTDANVHAALIVRHGKLVYERYFAGEDKAWATSLGRVSYHSGLKHDLRAISKSITSLLVGMAVDRGWIKDLDEPVFEGPLPVAFRCGPSAEVGHY